MLPKRLAAGALSVLLLTAPCLAGEASKFVGFARKAYREGKYDAAARLCDMALEKDKKNEAAWVVRGLSNAGLGAFAEAESDATKALDLGPTDVDALLLRAAVRRKLSRQADAEKDAKKAVFAEPERADAWKLLGELQESTGQLALAKNSFSKVAKLDPSYKPEYERFLSRNAGGLEERAKPGLKLPELSLPDVSLPSLPRPSLPGPWFWKALGAAAGSLALLAAAWRLRRVSASLPTPRRKTTGRPRRTPAGATLPPSTVKVSAGEAAAGGAAAAHPAKVQSYELRKEIGRGGMGVVYQGYDTSLGRKVAIKEMRPEIAHSPRDKERFLNEARLVAKFQHPNIVAIHSILEQDGIAYLVFEYVEGESLDSVLRRHGRLSAEVALPLLRGIAEALDYAHRQKVIHRDLKPSNVMITDDDVPKVMDFGIAHQAKQSMTRLTNAEPTGTVAYMPPEQELGKASKQSDVFAFAALAFETLLGELPFCGPNFFEQKKEMYFSRPSRMSKAWRKELDAVFERAFDPVPEKRPASATEFVQALEAALSPRTA